MRDTSDAKAMAKALKLALAQDGIEIAHTRALEIVARQFDFPNWNVMSARLDQAEAPAIAFEQAVPIVRIFDLAKAEEFYFGFLGFTLDWDHRYGENFPIYMQVSRGDLRLHLSEHAGDATPGGNMCVYMKGIRQFHAELTDKNYRHMKPGIEKQDDGLEVSVTDPFNNRMRFMEIVG